MATLDVWQRTDFDPALASRVVPFARDGYAGINDTHLGELLAEGESICLSRSSGR